MARTKSSNRWLDEHFSDEYVLRAQREGYRSRAAFKLIELDEKHRFLKPGLTVVDLGAAPGSWSEVVVKRLQRRGKIVASDILDMEPIAGVNFLQGDFREEKVLDQLLELIAPDNADVVISDMAPNMSGNDAVDQPRVMYLVELAAELAEHTLKVGGTLVVKMFQGDGSDAFLGDLRRHYASVLIRKPAASRPRSREIYVVARGFRGAGLA